VVKPDDHLYDDGGRGQPTAKEGFRLARRQVGTRRSSCPAPGHLGVRETARPTMSDYRKFSGIDLSVGGSGGERRSLPRTEFEAEERWREMSGENLRSRGQGADGRALTCASSCPWGGKNPSRVAAAKRESRARQDVVSASVSQERELGEERASVADPRPRKRGVVERQDDETRVVRNSSASIAPRYERRIPDRAAQGHDETNAPRSATGVLDRGERPDVEGRSGGDPSSLSRAFVEGGRARMIQPRSIARRLRNWAPRRRSAFRVMAASNKRFTFPRRHRDSSPSGSGFRTGQ